MLNSLHFVNLKVKPRVHLFVLVKSFAVRSPIFASLFPACVGAAQVPGVLVPDITLSIRERTVRAHP